MSSVPRVSVILTVYKRTDYLAEALESISAQSYQDYEIIVADDSGTAVAKPIVATFGNRKPVKYLANRSTIGVASSVARAVKEARGDFIAILNDDDLWHADLLEKLIAPLNADSDRVLATSDHWIMDAGGHIDRALTESWSVNFGRSSLCEGVVSDAIEFVVVKGGPAINITSLFRKDAIDWSLLVPEVTGAYDYWISCLLMATRKPIYYVPERLGRWRTHPRMETCRRGPNKSENLVYVYSTLLERNWFPEVRPVLKAKLREALFAAGRDKLLFDRPEDARAYFLRCFRLSMDVQALIRAAATFLPRTVRSKLRAYLSRLRTRRTYQQTNDGGLSSVFSELSLRKD
jgi:glycosyltransferase involved in cell wall biosynthesis